MKRRRFKLLAVTLVLGLVVAACGDDAADEEVTLRLGHGFVAQHPINVGVLERWKAAVEDASDGSIKVDIIPGGAMGPAPGTYQNTVDGGQELGWALQGYTPGRFPLTQVVEAPFVFDSAVQGTNALWDLYEEFEAFRNEYSDVKVLGLWVHDIGDLWTKEGPLRRMEDIAGKSLRSPGPMSGDLITELGGTVVGMPAPEIYDNLDSGAIDGLMIAISALTSFDLYDQLFYGITCNCYVAAQYFVMNLDAWNGLSTAQKAAIDSITPRTVSGWGAEVYDAEYAAADARVNTENIERFVLSSDPAEEARWFAAGDRVVSNWIAAAADGEPRQAMWDKLRELVGN